MGWGDCGNDDRGRPIGYNFAATCDHHGCEAAIDRGLSYVCGGMHGGGTHGCGGYFCPEHKLIAKHADGTLQGVCEPCYFYGQWDDEDEAPTQEGDDMKTWYLAENTGNLLTLTAKEPPSWIFRGGDWSATAEAAIEATRKQLAGAVAYAKKSAEEAGIALHRFERGLDRASEAPSPTAAHPTPTAPGWYWLQGDGDWWPTHVILHRGELMTRCGGCGDHQYHLVREIGRKPHPPGEWAWGPAILSPDEVKP